VVEINVKHLQKYLDQETAKWGVKLSRTQQSNLRACLRTSADLSPHQCCRSWRCSRIP